MEEKLFEIWNFIKKYLKIRSRSHLVNGFRRRFDKLLFRKKFGNAEIAHIIRSLGITKGSNVFVHSSWDEFYNYSGTPKDFIDAILNEIGEEGTLLMPAYPLTQMTDDMIFDIKRTPTGAGLIAEVFRRYPGVKRSINTHSVCALGPLSDYLLDEHRFSSTCWDQKSPYYKISLTETVILSFGLGKSYFPTSYHCTESMLKDEVPYFGQFFTKKIKNKFRLEDKSLIEVESYTADDGFLRRFTNRSVNRIVGNYFDKTKYKKLRLSNLVITMYDASYLINRMIELGRAGKTIFTRPRPGNYFK